SITCRTGLDVDGVGRISTRSLLTLIAGEVVTVNLTGVRGRDADVDRNRAAVDVVVLDLGTINSALNGVVLNGDEGSPVVPAIGLGASSTVRQGSTGTGICGRNRRVRRNGMADLARVACVDDVALDQGVVPADDLNAVIVGLIVAG